MKIADRISATIVSVAIISGTYAAGPVTGPNYGEAPAGLDGRNIALWQSHGLYYNKDKSSWIWQRAHLLQTVEDLYSASYVVDLLAPMLENAGAYVMMPRERDTNRTEIIIDPDSGSTPGYSEHQGTNVWTTSGEKGFAMTGATLTDSDNPFRAGSTRIVKTTSTLSEESTAQWNVEIPVYGIYSVYISYPSLPNSSSEVIYRVTSMRGTEEFTVDQTMGGGTWIRLGEFPFAAGKSDIPIVEVSNFAKKKNVGKVVGADAVRIGGGMGTVEREGTVSGSPRWMEGARYWLQFAGMPESVYASSDNANDYTDDFRSRPNWVNYLTGGSMKAPREKGLGIPIDLALAFHTDAGMTPDSTTIGTLGIYSTDSGKRLGDKRSRTTNKVLTEKVVNSIVNDIRTLYDTDWTKRKIRNAKYAEARIPVVPSVLIELLSHQNMADMRLGQDPEFRFTVARAIYKGILRYLHSTDKGKGDCTVQPLPVRNFAILNRGGGKYTLRWEPTADQLEPTADPTRYIIERRLGNGAFITYRTVNSTEMDYTADPGVMTSFRIIAANDGGRAFPSEVLALCHFDNGNPEILIVNGFTRVSAPESFDSEGEAGFLDEFDHGVPYIRNIAYSGSQYDFDRESLWEDDIVHPGFGASYSNYDGVIVAGNTFDYPAVHGRAIADNGFPFCSTSVGAYCNPANHFNQPIVDLILGKQRQIIHPADSVESRFKAFPQQLQQRLREHIAANGNLFVSGAYIATDLYENTFSNDSTIHSDSIFARDILGIKSESPFAATSGSVEGLPFWANGFQEVTVHYANRPNESVYVVESPDAIVGADPVKSQTIMTYRENGKSAAVAWDNEHNSVIAAGFPFEAIVDDATRYTLMKEILAYLTTVRRPMAPRSNLHHTQPPALSVECPSSTPPEQPISKKQ